MCSDSSASVTDTRTTACHSSRGTGISHLPCGQLHATLLCNAYQKRGPTAGSQVPDGAKIAADFAALGFRSREDCLVDRLDSCLPQVVPGKIAQQTLGCKITLEQAVIPQPGL